MITPSTLSRTVAAIHADIHKARSDPMHYPVLVFGDFNYVLPNDRALCMDGLHHVSAMPGRIKVPAKFAPLQHALSKLLLFSIDKPTHYDH
eukprot:10417116-Karenia_brevis.AAC.1